MCEQPFKYGKRVVGWNNDCTEFRGEYVAFQRAHDRPHIIQVERFGIIAFHNARSADRPNLKKGQPLLVSEGDDTPHVMAAFRGWNGDRVVAAVRYECRPWDNYALLKNYDYEADINEGI